MKFTLQHNTSDTLSNLDTPCLVVAIYQDGQLSQSASALDQASKGYISEILSTGDLQDKPGATLLLHRIPNITAKRVILVSTGTASTKPATFIKTIKGLATSLKKVQISSVYVCLDDIKVTEHDTAWKIQQCCSIFGDSAYQFSGQKSGPAPQQTDLNVALGVSELDATTNQQATKQGEALIVGKAFAKDLGNLPGNICTPSYLADQAKTLASDYGNISTTILDEAEMDALGMHCLLSVSAGSEEPAKLIVMEYTGTDDQSAPHVLVGKGITFDSGGISLKPGAQMDEMKYDMCGAASVFGTMKAIAELNLKVNVVAIVPAAENMPSGNATKPGDIVKTMSGLSVEILNTDAEGRLILCDALTYSLKYKPASIVDIATLTGACMMALGKPASGLFTTSDELANSLSNAGNASHDRVWRLPLWDDYQGLLDSNFADMANIGGKLAGAITAACFLSRFTEDQKWAHLDIAGTAWNSGSAKGATGRPVGLLLEYICQQSA